MKKSFQATLTAFMLFIVMILTACGPSHTAVSNMPVPAPLPPPTPTPTQNVAVNILDPADTLDPNLVLSIFKQVGTPEGLEQELNKIANLDLDDDKAVDYISVTEFQENPPNPNLRNFGLTASNSLGTQNLGSISVQRNGQQYAASYAPDPVVYGHGHYYHSNFTLADAILLNWLFAPRPIYVSPYHYGYYPRAYVRPVIVPVAQYRTQTATVVKRTNVTVVKQAQPTITTKAVSPVANKTIQNIPVLNNRSTQKQLDVRDGNKALNSGGGFGQKTGVNPASTTTKPVVTQTSPTSTTSVTNNPKPVTSTTSPVVTNSSQPAVKPTTTSSGFSFPATTKPVTVTKPSPTFTQTAPKPSYSAPKPSTPPRSFGSSGRKR